MQALDSVPMVIAIDGPSGSGKSTVARGVAEQLGFGYLDTGATYRGVTWLVLQQDRPVDRVLSDVELLDALLVSSALGIGTGSADRAITVNGRDITDVIRGAEVTAAVSAVAASPAVREYLSRLQRSLATDALAGYGGMVVEGRDIGTAIFPDAPLKIWLTATPEVRGRRRAAELSDGAPQAQVTVEGTVEQLARRDVLDSTRSISPLLCADDAAVLDTSAMTADEVVSAVLGLWNTVTLPDAGSATAPGGPHGLDARLRDSASGATR